MSDIIRDAVDAAIATFPGDYLGGALKPGSVIHRALQTAARHAAEAMKERIATKFDASDGTASKLLAAGIRAIPTEGDMT